MSAVRAVLLALTCGGLGCGPVTYTIDAADAERSVDQARAHNAMHYAPYELAFALAHLEKAREEAAAGAYEDAIRLAEVARAYGARAVSISRRGARAER